MLKAYRSNTQSKQVDGLYKHEKYSQKPVLLNHTRTKFNILNPMQKDNKLESIFATSNYKKNPVSAIRYGKCHQVYGISDFVHGGKQGKFHEKF